MSGVKVIKAGTTNPEPIIDVICARQNGGCSTLMEVPIPSGLTYYKIERDAGTDDYYVPRVENRPFVVCPQCGSAIPMSSNGYDMIREGKVVVPTHYPKYEKASDIAATQSRFK
jgi:hypothetical protein